jgi:hypothetical protein
VTVFHRDRNKWKHKKDQNDQDGEDQLQPFLDAITNNGLVYVWGNQNPSKTPPRNTLPSPKPSKSESQFSNKPILKHQPPQT